MKALAGALKLLLVLGVLAFVLLPLLNCVSEGTLVETPNGPRPIETLHVGDAVLSLGPDGRVTASRVTVVRKSFATWWKRLSLGSTHLELTIGHPVASARGWLPAGSLTTGDSIHTTGGLAVVRGVETRIGWRAVYDLSVDAHENFIAAGVVVHNKSIRSPLAANEAGAVGDARAVGSSEVAYSSSNGGYFGHLSCLGAPPRCGWDAGVTPFLDESTSSLKPKRGYARSFIAGPKGAGKPDPGIQTFVYVATPVDQGKSGVRGFAIDHTGLICVTHDGSVPPIVAGALSPDCTPLK